MVVLEGMPLSMAAMTNIQGTVTCHPTNKNGDASFPRKSTQVEVWVSDSQIANVSAIMIAMFNNFGITGLNDNAERNKLIKKCEIRATNIRDNHV